MTKALRSRRSLQERLWSKVQRGHVTECWIWHGATNRKGYGLIGTNDIERHRGGRREAD